LGHELVHHKQNCDGKFENAGDMGEGYAQKNPHLRQMEIEANSVGSMCLRDFEDGLREQKTIYYEHLQKGEKTMSMKDWKNKELTTLLSEAWGFKFNTLQEFDEFNGTGEIQEEGEEELEELAQARQPRERAKPHGTGARVEPTAPFGKPPTDKDEEEEEPLEELANARQPDERRKPHGTGRRVEDDPALEAKDEEDEEEVDEADINEGEGKDELREVIKTLLGKYIKG
jgi:hypothetical protein